jgi:hypothetical protein
MHVLKDLLKAELENYPPHPDVSTEIIALNKVLAIACKVDSGKKAMDLIIASDRVYRHLSHRRDGNKEFRMNIAIREWNTIRPELEFRFLKFKKYFL